jgi:hypothetical protein
MFLFSEEFAITALSFMFMPVLAVLFLTILLGSIGKSLGIRKLYVRLLLRIFEV